jgi:hypothetical protein
MEAATSGSPHQAAGALNTLMKQWGDSGGGAGKGGMGVGRLVEGDQQPHAAGTTGWMGGDQQLHVTGRTGTSACPAVCP